MKYSFKHAILLVNEIWRLAFSTDSSKRRIILRIYFTLFSVVTSLCSKNLLTSVFPLIVSSSSLEFSERVAAERLQLSEIPRIYILLWVTQY